jgi:hypothetical protein
LSRDYGAGDCCEDGAGGDETVRTSVAEFDDGDEFLLWLELLEDFEPPVSDKAPLSDSDDK